MGAAALVFVAVRFAQPILDGDIFWHMVYGAQIVERGTLRTDHSLYSWMPASNDTIYCAWTGELLFLFLWKMFGIAGMFALRYAAVLGVAAMFVWQGRRLGLLARPETWLVVMIMLLASVVGTILKPELLSLVLWNGLVFCWYSAWWAIQQGHDPRRWLYAMPGVMLVWVNTHGGFILAAPFLAIVTVYGVLSFPKTVRRHLAVAAGLCVIVTAINPYGVRYPLALAGFALGGAARRPDIAWNNAFQPTLNAAGSYFRLPELLVWMAAGVAIGCWSRRKGWLLVVGLFLAYTPIYLLYLRSTFLLPALFAYGVLFLSRPQTGPKWRGVLACVALVALAGRSVYATAFHPERYSWLGFGISYFEPVDEAEFVARHALGTRLYNSYDVGGYLMWRLYPRDKVMVDSRSFPYLSWFGELIQFSETQDPQVFQDFLRRHPADVAVVEFADEPAWRSFLETPGWRPAFYGPAAVVFVRDDGSENRLEVAESLKHLRNGKAGIDIFNFARAVGDYRTAWSLLDQMQARFGTDVGATLLEPMLAYRDGQTALRAGNYSWAWECFARSFARAPVVGRDQNILLMLRALLGGRASPQQAASLKAAIAQLAAPR